MTTRLAKLSTGPIWNDLWNRSRGARESHGHIMSGFTPWQCNGEADVVIVGAGIAGLSVALHLLRRTPGMRVIVLESQHVGFGASTRNSGMLTPGVGQSLARLVKRFGPRVARKMYVSSLDAVEYLSDLAGQEGMEIGLQLSGQLIVARGRAGRSRLASQARMLEELTLPFSTLDDDQLAQRVRLCAAAPGVGPAALYLPIAGVLNPARLVHGLAAAVGARGGTIVQQAKVRKLSANSVALDNGQTIKSQKVVVATNAYDTSLSAQRGRLVPMHLRMLATRPLTTRELDSIGWHHREGVIDSRRIFNYFRLTEDNRLVFGGGLPRYRWGGNVRDIQSDVRSLQRLADEMNQLFPFLTDRDVRHTWTGVIAYSLDTLPTVGSVANHAGVFHLGGWSGHGIALSVSFGRIIADLIQGKPCTPAPWLRDRAPRVPSELGRWCGTRLGAWTTRLMDQFT